MTPVRQPRVSTRIARSRVPVNPTFSPAMNAPAWALGLLGLFGAVLAATDGWPVWAVVVIFVVMVAFGVVTQFFTTPARELRDHGDDPLEGD